MMYKKSIPMCFEQAAKISNDLLDVFQELFVLSPLKLSTVRKKGLTKIITFSILPDKKTKSIKRVYTYDDYCLDHIYQYIVNKRCFEITLFDDPDDLGYCSMLPDFNPYTYVLCNIVEKRPNGAKKYELTFGFDIEKGTFLELFEVVHYNSVGILREYPNLNSLLETELKDVVIL